MCDFCNFPLYQINSVFSVWFQEKLLNYLHGNQSRPLFLPVVAGDKNTNAYHHNQQPKSFCSFHHLPPSTSSSEGFQSLPSFASAPTSAARRHSRALGTEEEEWTRLSSPVPSSSQNNSGDAIRSAPKWSKEHKLISDSSESFFLGTKFKTSLEDKGGVDESSIWEPKSSGESKIDEIRKLLGEKAPRKISLSSQNCYSNKNEINLSVNEINSSDQSVRRQIKKFEAFDNFGGQKIVKGPEKSAKFGQPHDNPYRKFFERKLSVSNIKEFNDQNQLLGIYAKKFSESTPEVQLNNNRSCSPNSFFNKTGEVPKLIGINRRSSVDQSVGFSCEFHTPRSFASSSGFSQWSNSLNCSNELSADSGDPRKSSVSSPNYRIGPISERLSSSDSTEVIISDRESLTDSGEINRKTVIHISRKKSRSSPVFPTQEEKEFSDTSTNVNSTRPALSNKHWKGSSGFEDVNKFKISIHSKGRDEILPSYSRMYVKQSDAWNRPSRASAFNVRQTIEKRSIEQERRERKALRKKIREQIRCVSEQRERLSSTDSDASSSVYVSCSSVRSKSLSSLDQDQEENRCESPLVKVQSSPTLEKEKESISNYLYSSNLTDYSPCVSSRLVASVMTSDCLSESNRSRDFSDVTQENAQKYARERQVSLVPDSVQAKSSLVHSVGSSHNLKSLTDSEKWRIKNKKHEEKSHPSANNPFSQNKSTGDLANKSLESNDPPSIRFARERRSLRTNRLMVDDISDRTSSVASVEPDWVKRARKKLESLNLPLCSTTEAGSVSSHLTESSSAWSRGGLDALDDLRQETAKFGIALAEEANTRVTNDLSRINQVTAMLEHQKSSLKGIDSMSNQHNRVTFGNSVQNNHDANERSQLSPSQKEQVKFGDLKHDWGGVKNSKHFSKQKDAKFGETHSGDKSNYQSKVQAASDSSSAKNSSLSRATRDKSPNRNGLPVMHFGDMPFNVVPSVHVPEVKQSSKFESISGPDPTTMSAEQLNQNVEEYDFPIPTGNENPEEICKFVEESVMKEEAVPEVISSEEFNSKVKPKSILKRRSVENGEQDSQKTSKDTVSERLKKWERRKSSPADWASNSGKKSQSSVVGDLKKGRTNHSIESILTQLTSEDCGASTGNTNTTNSNSNSLLSTNPNLSVDLKNNLKKEPSKTNFLFPIKEMKSINTKKHSNEKVLNNGREILSDKGYISDNMKTVKGNQVYGDFVYKSTNFPSKPSDNLLENPIMKNNNFDSNLLKKIPETYFSEKCESREISQKSPDCEKIPSSKIIDISQKLGFEVDEKKIRILSRRKSDRYLTIPNGETITAGTCPPKKNIYSLQNGSGNNSPETKAASETMRLTPCIKCDSQSKKKKLSKMCEGKNVHSLSWCIERPPAAVSLLRANSNRFGVNNYPNPVRYDLPFSSSDDDCESSSLPLALSCRPVWARFPHDHCEKMNQSTTLPKNTFDSVQNPPTSSSGHSIRPCTDTRLGGECNRRHSIAIDCRLCRDGMFSKGTSAKPTLHTVTFCPAMACDKDCCIDSCYCCAMQSSCPFMSMQLANESNSKGIANTRTGDRLQQLESPSDRGCWSVKHSSCSRCPINNHSSRHCDGRYPKGASPSPPSCLPKGGGQRSGDGLLNLWSSQEDEGAATGTSADIVASCRRDAYSESPFRKLPLQKSSQLLECFGVQNNAEDTETDSGKKNRQICCGRTNLSNGTSDETSSVSLKKVTCSGSKSSGIDSDGSAGSSQETLATSSCASLDKISSDENSPEQKMISKISHKVVSEKTNLSENQKAFFDEKQTPKNSSPYRLWSVPEIVRNFEFISQQTKNSFHSPRLQKKLIS